MIHIFVRPMDVWLFRDGRPFNGDGDHRAESLFPPFPSVVQGAIRSYMLMNPPEGWNGDVIKLIGTVDTFPQDFKIQGPFVAKMIGGKPVCYFPEPADAVSLDGPPHGIRPASAPRFSGGAIKTSSPLPMCLGLDDPLTKGETNLWLAEPDLHEYLRGKSVLGQAEESLFQRQVYPGIGVQNERRTNKEGALFEVEYIAPLSEVGLYIGIEGVGNFPSSGLLQMGGEKRVGAFETVDAPTHFSPPAILPQRFKVYFASPTFFEAGSVPKDWSVYFDGSVTLVAAAVNRYLTVGGYDYAANTHKPGRRFVPAGSVYYFQSNQPVHLTPLAQQGISDWGSQAGFGQYIIKGW